MSRQRTIPMKIKVSFWIREDDIFEISLSGPLATAAENDKVDAILENLAWGWACELGDALEAAAQAVVSERNRPADVRPPN